MFYIQCTVQCSMFSIQCSISSIQASIDCIQCSISQFTVFYCQYSVYYVQCSLSSIICSISIIQYSIASIQSSVTSIQCSIYRILSVFCVRMILELEGRQCDLDPAHLPNNVTSDCLKSLRDQSTNKKAIITYCTIPQLGL